MYSELYNEIDMYELLLIVIKNKKTFYCINLILKENYSEKFGLV